MADPLPLIDPDADRKAFAKKVDQVLQAIEGFRSLLEGSVGKTLELELAVRTLRGLVLETFDQGLPFRREAILYQLVREAFDHFQDPASKVDLREWVKAAKKILKAERTEGE